MPDISADTPVYPISVARRLTGLSDRQIRYYEQVGLLVPLRTEGRHRMYSQREVELLIRIRDEMARGLRTDEIRRQLGLDRLPVGNAAATPGRATLPHFAAGEVPDDDVPDVEARRAFMARQGGRREP